MFHPQSKRKTMSKNEYHLMKLGVTPQDFNLILARYEDCKQ
jgi:hypothetical protein